MLLLLPLSIGLGISFSDELRVYLRPGVCRYRASGQHDLTQVCPRPLGLSLLGGRFVDWTAIAVGLLDLLIILDHRLPGRLHIIHDSAPAVDLIR